MTRRGAKCGRRREGGGEERAGQERDQADGAGAGTILCSFLLPAPVSCRLFCRLDGHAERLHGGDGGGGGNGLLVFRQARSRLPQHPQRSVGVASAEDGRELRDDVNWRISMVRRRARTRTWGRREGGGGEGGGGGGGGA
eukprot:766755-Hanusia_phi.AAC.1